MCLQGQGELWLALRSHQITHLDLSLLDVNRGSVLPSQQQAYCQDKATLSPDIVIYPFS